MNKALQRAFYKLLVESETIVKEFKGSRAIGDLDEACQTVRKLIPKPAADDGRPAFACYYFGYVDEGHMLYGPDGRIPAGKQRFLELPWEKLDGDLAPRDPKQKQGVCRVHREKGWMAIAFWDRSGDDRGNSNSVFIVEGDDHTFPQALAIAQATFPAIYDRFGFELREA
jgi:hypothetical protein